VKTQTCELITTTIIMAIIIIIILINVSLISKQCSAWVLAGSAHAAAEGQRPSHLPPPFPWWRGEEGTCAPQPLKR